tara:strand:- start:281 stop:880 length:600 start_codon:yes stop_codon:yes gene_type:complete
MNDSLYNFNDKSDIDDTIKLNMDELYIKKQQQDLNILNNYNKILIRIHNKIKYISKQLINDMCCWYIVPEMMIGIPKYNHKDCTIYVIEKLRDNGFIVRYTHPNLLFISWKHWVPTYVRNEIKKKTGTIVDEYGNIINKDIINNNTENMDNNKEELIFNNRNKNKIDKVKTDYKDIKSYNPSGNLIYSNNLLKKLDINS